MYCKECGKKLSNGSTFCSECGANQLEEKNNKKQTVEIQVEEEGTTIGWGFLGFFVPIAGLILFIVWKLNKPKSAKAAGLGALISVIFNFLLIIGLILLTVVLSVSEVTSNSIYY